MGRAPCCDERLALKKGPWTPDEDQKLVAYIQDHGHGNWRALPEKAGLARCGKSCRLRWTNYLRPDIKRGRFTSEEDQTIIQLHAILGNRWSAIASHLPRRTDNEIKNYWNTHLKKRLTQMGIDPVTHKVSAAGLALSPQWTPLASTRLSHISQWEIALAEAQARLSKTPTPVSNHAYLLQDQPHPSSFFMRSWTTKLEDKRSPCLPAPRPQSTRNWNAVLGLPRESELAPLSNAMAVMNDTAAFSSWPEESNAPELKAEIQFDMPDSRCSGFSFSYDVAEADVYDSAPEGVAIENLFSPTSILQGPDSSDSCSSASGTHNYNHPDCCFPTTMIQHHSSCFPSFAAHHDDIPETFWQAAGSALLVDHVNAGAHSAAAGMELMAPLCFHNGDVDDHALPPFDQSMCHGAH